jgi:hypothetical protein
MIPASITAMPSLPRTANGKIDRKSLPAPGFTGRMQTRTYAPPETPQQKKLAEIWAEVLNLDRVSVTDNIFELGADSLLIFRISARAGQEGLPIAPAQIFKHRTIASLSSVLNQAETLGPHFGPGGGAIPPVPRDRFRRQKA